MDCSEHGDISQEREGSEVNLMDSGETPDITDLVEVPESDFVVSSAKLRDV